MVNSDQRRIIESYNKKACVKPSQPQNSEKNINIIQIDIPSRLKEHTDWREQLPIQDKGQNYSKQNKVPLTSEHP